MKQKFCIFVKSVSKQKVSPFNRPTFHILALYTIQITE